MKKRIASFLQICVILIFLLGSANLQTVLAQDETPAASEPVIIETDSPIDVVSELPSATEPPAAELAPEVVVEAPTEVATEVVTEVATEIPTEVVTEVVTEVPTEVPTEVVTEVAPDLVSELPTAEATLAIEATPPDLSETVSELADASITLVNEDNIPLDMASQETVDLMVNGDPWFYDTSNVLHRFLLIGSGTCPVAGDPDGTLCTVSSTPIQDAVTAAADGTTIHIEAGDYQETVNINNRILTIEGAGSSTVLYAPTTIPTTAGENIGSDYYYGLFYIHGGSNVTISNMVFNAGLTFPTLPDNSPKPSSLAGILLDSSSAYINNVAFLNFKTADSNAENAGIIISGIKNAFSLGVDGNTFTNNNYPIFNTGNPGQPVNVYSDSPNTYENNSNPSNITISGEGDTGAKMKICHWDNGKREFSTRLVSVNSTLDTTTCTLKTSAHGGHPLDLISAYTCAPGLEYPGRGDQATIDNDCVAPVPALTLTKTVPTGTSYKYAGDTITYTYTLKNEGNVDLDGPITITDDQIGTPKNTAFTCSSTSLAEGASTTCTATYTITAADVTAGYVTNNAYGHASFGGNSVDSNLGTVTVTMTADPKLTLTKTVPAATTYKYAGDTITYTYTLKNEGNVTLVSPFTVTDDQIGTPKNTAFTCSSETSLAPGASTSCTATYTITAADVTAGYVTNNAYGHASYSGKTVDSNLGTVTVTMTADPKLTLTKTVPAATSYTTVGDTITYTYSVKNDGNVDLDGPITITDDQIGTFTCSASGLASGATTSCTATYTIKAADITAQSVTNLANAYASYKSVEVKSNLDTVTVDMTADPGMTLEKLVIPGSYGVVGAVLNYTYTVTNVGNVPLTDLSVADNKVPVVCASTTLAVGASTTCTASYNISQADLDAGSVTNLATANGLYGKTDVASNQASATATANTGPALFVSKTITSAGPNLEGSTISYNLLITNTGNVTLTNVTVTDPKATIIGTCFAASLAPAASFSCLASHVVTAADITAGLSYLNTATATSGNISASGSVTAGLDIAGCIDPTALNYNPSATISDGSCVYPVTPPVTPPPGIITVTGGGAPALGIPVTGGVGGVIPVTGGKLIVSGLGHSCMTFNDGQVICWGLNASGQLGDGTTIDQKVPVYVKDLTGVQNLTAGSKHTCALTISGEIWCWGENSSGQLGNGTTVNSSVPVLVTGLPDKVINITAGEEFTCVQLKNQDVWCWGKNDLGQLNDGTTKNQLNPVKTKLTTMFAQISGGQGLLLGSDLFGSVNQWANVKSTAVQQVLDSLSISANRWGSSGCAVAADGTVKCWGSDLISVPVQGSLPALEVGAGLAHNCDINADETVSCWGINISGQLGNGTFEDSSSATLVKNLAKVHALAVGANHTCILTGVNNTPLCWGENTYGQLGNNTNTKSNLPVFVILPGQ